MSVIRGTTVTTPLARHAVTDDTAVSKKPWSSKNTVDKLCPSFTESGAVVVCEPIEGYPLEVVSEIPAEVGVSKITLYHSNEDESNEYTVDFHDSYSNGRYNWTTGELKTEDDGVIQFAPKVITALYGENTFHSDCGDTTVSGKGDSGKILAEAITFTPQRLTEKQKAQARDNIGTAPLGDVQQVLNESAKYSFLANYGCFISTTNGIKVTKNVASRTYTISGLDRLYFMPFSGGQYMAMYPENKTLTLTFPTGDYCIAYIEIPDNVLKTTTNFTFTETDIKYAVFSNGEPVDNGKRIVLASLCKKIFISNYFDRYENEYVKVAKKHDFLVNYGCFVRPKNTVGKIEITKDVSNRTYILSNIDCIFFLPFLGGKYIRLSADSNNTIKFQFPIGSSNRYCIAYIELTDHILTDGNDLTLSVSDVKYRNFSGSTDIDYGKVIVLASYNDDEKTFMSNYFDGYYNEHAIADIEAKMSGVADLSADYFQKGASGKAFAKKLGIIAAGQSNIDGRVPYADMPSEIKNAMPMANCHYVKNSTSVAFTSLDITGNWAFDLVTYFNICKNPGSELYVIKWSEGGTSIDPDGDSTSHWSADYEEVIAKGHTSLLRKFEDSIRKHIESNGSDFDIRAFIWHQGEGDRDVPDNYYENLKYMIAYVRGVVGNKNLPFITGTISHNSQQFNKIIEDAQTRLSAEDANFHLIDMSGATLLDPYHFDATSQEYFGKKVYDCLIDIGVVSGEKLNPVKPW